MADYTAKKIDDMEAIYGGGFKRARAELGVEAFGMQVIDMPPNFENYPEHDHSDRGVEEVYVVLRGSAEIDVDGERVQIDPDTVIRVGPGSKRKITPGDQGVRLLALGGSPGNVYEPPDVTQLGSPDPSLAQT
jgi:mannose-6-phosphate isomerase-like protein (cupin superfamily)